MNLFVLDFDFEINAAMHVDHHVNKIALEALQCLSTALCDMCHSGVSYDASWWYNQGRWDSDARRSVHRAYTPTHHGPISKWCQNPVNYMWTLRYAIELCKEHQFRKGTIIQQWRVLSQLPRFTVYESPKIWYAAVADELLTSAELANGKLVGNDRVIELYHQYYIAYKSHLHTWTKRPRPIWIPQPMDA